MRKSTSLVILICLAFGGVVSAAREIEIRKQRFTSQTPPFTLTTLSEYQLVHSSSFDIPKENSRTRVYLFIRDRNKQVEEMFLVEIADKTNPQAGPMVIPPLRPVSEKRLFRKEIKKKGDLEIDYLIQLMAWNPDAPSLQPILNKGYVIPRHWVFQGQILFGYLGEHAVLIRYSKDTNAFGFRVTEEGAKWNKEEIKGNEKKAYEIFQKGFLEMVGSIALKNP